jgi:hypothetical protein
VLAMEPGASSCSMRLVTVEVSFCIMLPRYANKPNTALFQNVCN